MPPLNKINADLAPNPFDSSLGFGADLFSTPPAMRRDTPPPVAQQGSGGVDLTALIQALDQVQQGQNATATHNTDAFFRNEQQGRGGPSPMETMPGMQPWKDIFQSPTRRAEEMNNGGMYTPEGGGAMQLNPASAYMPRGVGNAQADLAQVRSNQQQPGYVSPNAQSDGYEMPGAGTIGMRTHTGDGTTYPQGSTYIDNPYGTAFSTMAPPKPIAQPRPKPPVNYSGVFA